MQTLGGEYILLVGVDTLSRFIDFSDRSIAVSPSATAPARSCSGGQLPEDNGILFTKMGRTAPAGT